MATPSNRVAIPGSERHAVSGATKLDTLDPDRTMWVSVYVRPRQQLPEAGTAAPMSREEFAAAHGASPEDLAKVEAFARDHGLTVDESDAARRLVKLSGPASAMAAAFGVELAIYEHPDGGRFRGRVGAVTMPADVAEIVQSVHGLDDRPQARPHVRTVHGVAPHATGGDFTPVQVAELYGFPKDSDGSGECVAIIELGGGYTDADLQQFFSGLGLPVPPTVSVAVDGIGNTPGKDTNADMEVALDIEVVGAVAPGVRMAVYFAPNTDQGFLDAITQAAHDTTNRPSVISISWGGPESTWSGQSFTTYDQAFQAAAAMGVTVTVAAGDNGSSDGVTTDKLAHVDFPASSPNVLACGGTNLAGSATTITREVVWNQGGGATGGGISDVFPLPDYQQNMGVPPSANPRHHVGRGVPDVSGDADPATGYRIVVAGKDQTVGGTSAVAPLWAGLVARVNSQLKTTSGLVNRQLYANPGAMRDITEGNNGAYKAGPGWDACTGLGSPDGEAVLRALTP